MTNNIDSITPESLFTPELTHWIKSSIPLLQNMEVTFDQFENGKLIISCPLEPNINDKGTAFGGSMAALATLCGWLYTTLYARTRVTYCEAVIADSQMTYHAPASGPISAHCQAVIPEKFITRLDERRNAKLELTVELYSCSEGSESEKPAPQKKVATYTGIYVAMP
ncbi:YiiD C-terminal domain-containing protein [Endozoicomonas sp.]|uniref:YiiD C-terminal domain-containing protein n=1 Tax=Endozoicomonas sp. TaxID=1892382 RepID=UPI00383BD18F